MRKTIGIVVALGVMAFAAVVLFNSANSDGKKRSPEARGKYLVKTAGCNDCHTPGYIEKSGQVDEAVWVTGDTLGWQGPWGTTYPINLRLFMQNLTEDQWLATVPKLKSRPPMPYWSLQAMEKEDLVAIYRYIRSLDPNTRPAPAYLPPGTEAPLPVMRFVPPT